MLETCPGALLRNHALGYGPAPAAKRVMSASVLEGQPADPRGLRDPHDVNKMQVERRWPERLQGHALLAHPDTALRPVLVGKGNNIRGRWSYASPTRLAFGLKPQRTVKHVALFLPNVTLWRHWSMLRSAALKLLAQLSPVFSPLASSWRRKRWAGFRVGLSE